MKLLLAWLVLAIWACSGGPYGSTSYSQATNTDNACFAACEKVLACFGVNDRAQTNDCVARCGEGDRVNQIAELDCDEIVAQLGAQLGNQNGGNQRGEQPAPRACTADCTGCVGDGTSCFAAAGGSHGIPCDDCCCAPGSKNPVWR